MDEFLDTFIRRADAQLGPHPVRRSVRPFEAKELSEAVGGGYLKSVEFGRRKLYMLTAKGVQRLKDKGII